MLKKLLVSIFVAAQILILAVSLSYAKKPVYIEGDVKNGGSIKGKISYMGLAPTPLKIDLKSKKNPEFCIENASPNDKGELLLHNLEVAGGGLKDAVVFIDDIKQGKPWSKNSFTIDFKNCQSNPKVTVVRKPGKSESKGLYLIKNHDEGVLHNPKGFSIGESTRKYFFKKWLLNKDSQVDMTKSMRALKKGRDTHFYIECEQHLWMTVSSRVVWNPYNVISAKDGSYKIDNIPAGKYRLVVWHPYAGEKSMEINVGPEKETEINLSLP